MNRRDFFKFFGKGAVVAGFAATVGLPEIEEQEPVAELELLEEVEYEFIQDGLCIWDGTTWGTLPANEYDVIDNRGLYMDSDGTLYVGGSFS